MADRNMPNRHVQSNTVGRVDISVQFTGAADVAASGYAVNRGVTHVSSVTRTAEGKLKVKFVDRYKRLAGLTVTMSIADRTWYLENDSLDTTDPHIDLVIRSVGAAPADVDPDSCVFRITATVVNSDIDPA